MDIVIRKYNESANLTPVQIPVGRMKCRWCGDTVHPGEDIAFDKDSEAWHLECIGEMCSSSVRDFVEWLTGVRLDVYRAEKDGCRAEKEGGAG